MGLGNKVTPYRRQALERLRDHGPLSIKETFQGHPNHMPTLIACGWVQAHGPSGLYSITEAGIEALEEFERRLRPAQGEQR